MRLRAVCGRCRGGGVEGVPLPLPADTKTPLVPPLLLARPEACSTGRPRDRREEKLMPCLIGVRSSSDDALSSDESSRDGCEPWASALLLLLLAAGRLAPAPLPSRMTRGGRAS